MGNFGLFILLFAFASAASQSQSSTPNPKPQCKFTSTSGFYAHVPSDLPIGDVVFRGSVTPVDAEMVVANVRSDVLRDLDWSDRVVIDQTDLSPGSYLVRLAASLSLPVYPSTLQEANLFITVVCNGYAYPLFTVHIDPTNRFAPQFYNEPYIMTLSPGMPAGSVFETPVAAIDWDPRDSYGLRFWLEDSHKGFILLEDTPRVVSKNLIPGSAAWPREQLPTVVRFQVTGPYQLPVTLRLTAQDGGKNGRKRTTFINLVEKIEGLKGKTTLVTLMTTSEPPTTSKTSKIPRTTTTTTSLPEVVLDSEVILTTTPRASSTSEAPKPLPDATLINNLKKTLSALITNKKDAEPDAIDAIAFAAKNSQLNAIETDETADQIEAFGAGSESSAPQAEAPPLFPGATRFSQCSMRVSLMENSPNGTEVAKLEVLNQRNDTVIHLIDPDDTFSIDNDTVVVNDSRLVDRELFSTLELVAEIQNSAPTTQCTRLRIYIDLDDENDNRPVFEHESYFFHVSTQFPIGREIGKLQAQDIDQGSNGQLTYHLLTPDVPFQVGTQGKWAILMSSGPMNAAVLSYNLTVEARDHGEEVVKSARVPVEVFVLGGGGEKVEKTKANGVKTATTTTEAPEDDSEGVEASEDSEDVKEASESSSKGSEAPEATAAPQDLIEAPESTLEDPEATSEDSEGPQAPEDVTEAPEATSKDSEAPEATTASEDLTEASKPASKASEASEEDVEVVTIIVEEEVEEEEEETPTPPPTTQKPVQNSLKDTDSAEDHSEDPSSDSEDTFKPSIPAKFSFAQPTYSYQAFGMEIRENDVLGRVAAQPHPEFYAVDREMIGIIKINEMGEILAGKLLNRHKDGAIEFGVSATNGFETARAQVTILRDANQDVMSTTPRFDQDTYKFEILENQQPEVIGIVRAFHSALSSSESLRLTYSLISPAHIDDLPFEIHQQSGEVSTSRPLDAEQQRIYKFQVRACLTQTICSTSDIQVGIRDANDNSPVLVNRKLEVTVESDVPPGTKIAKLWATDADSGNNSRIGFSIHSPENEIFQIDATSGQITTLQSLSLPLYTLLVDASDHGVPTRSDTAEVTVTVKGTNPSPPAFDQSEYKVTIGAPVRAGQVIGSVRATDPDPGMEGMVSYKLLRADNEDQNKFGINSKTGVISAMSQLDLEDGPIELNIEASDNGKNLKRRVKTQMRIEIIESKTLKFLPLPTTVYISTEKAVGSVILRVSAVSTQDEMIKFRVLQDQSQFVIDGDLLRVANHLIEGESTLSIRAETDTVKVDHQLRVIVMADRDKYPVFPQLTYDFDVSTDGHFPRVVHQFHAKLENGPLRYTFYPPTPPQGLYLDEKTGELFVTSQFRSVNTRETVFVVVRAVNQQADKYYSDVGVAITPISTTNPTLRFQQPTYNFEVYENLRQSDQIGTVSVTGAPTSEVKFSIVPDSEFLGIYPNGTLFLARPVDAEQMEDELVQEFTVTAATSSEDAKARITVAVRDVNEFSPEFDEEEVEMSIDSAATPGTRIGRVVAHDRDVSEKNKLIYRIVGGSGRKLVFIQEDGTIVVGDEKIDGQVEDSFDLIVEAVDRSGNHNSIHVTVYVDDADGSMESEQPPLFLGQPLVWNVTEGTTQSFELKATAGSQVRFKIIGGDPDGHFDIVHVPEEGTARLRIVSELDAKKQKVYALQVEALDERTRLTTVEEVEVHVNDSADKPDGTDATDATPTFQQPEYNAETPADLEIGKPIVTIKAAGPYDYTYTIQGDNCEELSIDENGVIAYQVPIGSRTKGSLICTVTATSATSTAETTLLLRVLESSRSRNRPPTFEQPEYQFNVSPVSSVLGTVKAVDPDNDRLELSIEPAEYANLFQVSADGRIDIRQKLEQPRYSFLVVATDGDGLSTFTNVKVVVGSGEASERDNEATIAMRPTAVARVTATSQPPTTTTIPLRFSHATYIFQASPVHPVGTIIGQVEVNRDEAQRRQENINFSLISGDYLAIDPEGRVSVVKSFDTEQTISDMVIVTRGNEVMAEARVEVAGLKSKTTVTPIPIPISTFQSPKKELEKLEKLEFSQPLYHAQVLEGSYISGIELDIQPPLSTNSKTPVHYSIEDPHVPFYLNDAGKLVMFEADREKQSEFVFSILANASTSTTPNQLAHSRINVTILDVNDNSPVFKEHLDTIGVLRSKHIGSPIYQLRAEDADADTENAVSYRLESSLAEKYFSIDEREGMIRVLQDLKSAPETVQITIVAADSGSPPMTSQVQIDMRMFDSEAPQLPISASESLKVPVTMLPGSGIADLLAGPLEERIQYRIDNDRSRLFEIDPQGTLRLSRLPLDGEKSQLHKIKVTAEHPQTGVKDVKELEVYVDGTDVPAATQTTVTQATSTMCQFSHKIYKAQVRENSPVKSAVTKVEAGCQDAQRKFRYAFHVPSNEFEIDSQSGQIYTSASLDRETKNAYFLTVNVIEQNRRKRQTDGQVEIAASKLSPWQALVVITILDENDNSPTFLHLLDDSTLSAVVDQNANLMTPVIHLQARDLDISPQTLTFGLEGAGTDNFYINRTNGLVQLTKSLKLSSQEHFELQATVTDSLHTTKVPLNVYVLSVDTNVVQLTKNSAHSEIDPSGLERKLTQVLDMDTRILVAQPFVDDNGHSDPAKSHVFVYSLEAPDRKPIRREALKELLLTNSGRLHDMDISSVSLLSTSGASSQTLLTVILLIVLCALLIFICALIMFCTKRRSSSQKNASSALEGSYMINSVGSGPRPYDVENISRATAQSVLAARPLPDAHEHRIDISTDTSEIERDDTTREFSNSVRERPVITQSAINR